MFDGGHLGMQGLHAAKVQRWIFKASIFQAMQTLTLLVESGQRPLYALDGGLLNVGITW